MKKVILNFAVIAAAVVLVSCGGGTPAGLPKNDILGNVPSLIYQKAKQDSIIEAKYYELTKDLEFEEIGKFHEDYLKESEVVEMKFKQDIEKEIKRLEGKTIPFTLSEGLGYEVTSLKIKSIDNIGYLNIEYSVKLTDVSKISCWVDKKEGHIFLTAKLVNKAGEMLGKYKEQFAVELPKDEIKSCADLKAGMEFSGSDSYTIKIEEDNAKEYIDFAKIVFVYDK